MIPGTPVLRTRPRMIPGCPGKDLVTRHRGTEGHGAMTDGLMDATWGRSVTSNEYPLRRRSQTPNEDVPSIGGYPRRKAFRGGRGGTTRGTAILAARQRASTDRRGCRCAKPRGRRGHGGDYGRGPRIRLFRGHL